MKFKLLVVFMLWLLASLLSAVAEDKPQAPSVSPEDRQALEIAKRDALLANRDRQLAEYRLDAAKRDEQRAIQAFQMKVEGLRARLKASEDEWDFDVDRLTFRRKPLPKPAANPDAQGDSGKHQPDAREQNHEHDTK